MADAVQPSFAEWMRTEYVPIRGGSPDEGGSPAAADPTEPEGQGDTAETQNGLYKDVLEGVPEEYHGPLTEKLKGMDAKATQKFQSHSERVKPYEDAGVFDADPEVVTGYLNLNTALEAAVGGDEQAQQQVHEWWDQVGDALGFYEDGEGGSENGSEPQDILDLDPQGLQDLVAKQTAEAVNPILERLDQQEQEKLLNEERENLMKDIREMREQNPGLTDEDQEDILGLAFQHGQDSDNPLQVGLEKFKKIVSRGESNLFAEKLNQPGPAEGGGMPNTAAPIPTSENAKELALERLKQMSATQ